MLAKTVAIMSLAYSVRKIIHEILYFRQQLGTLDITEYQNIICVHKINLKKNQFQTTDFKHHKMLLQRRAIINTKHDYINAFIN